MDDNLINDKKPINNERYLIKYIASAKASVARFLFIIAILGYSFGYSFAYKGVDYNIDSMFYMQQYSQLYNLDTYQEYSFSAKMLSLKSNLPYFYKVSTLSFNKPYMKNINYHIDHETVFHHNDFLTIEHALSINQFQLQNTFPSYHINTNGLDRECYGRAVLAGLVFAAGWVVYTQIINEDQLWYTLSGAGFMVGIGLVGGLSKCR